jgi:formylglycine-generating enzyme required for sulfatase activity
MGIAARAGTTTKFAFGADDSAVGDHAWYQGNAGARAHPVGGKKPNAFGLHDMFGNVWEWVEDPWHANYIGAPADGSVWIEGGDTRYWTLRGGAWNFPHAYLTASFRSNVLNTTPTRLSFYGFRVARDLER